MTPRYKLPHFLGVSMHNMDYRADVDGLRALAVLGVMFFHLGFPAFSGGYVGVDVFFVISGFLITRLIRDEILTSGAFSFSGFYTRRARRLLPAMFFTFAVTFAGAFSLFSPHDLQRFGGALVHAVASISNFFFWSESGYFDADSSVKPLLHMWSLSVEGQFYLIWPAGLVFLLTMAPRFALPLALVAGALVSLLLNLEFEDGNVPLLTRIAPSTADWFSDGPSTIFYLSPFRIFEFAIGASTVWLVEHPPKSRSFAELLAIAGLAMIAFPMLFYSEATVFPSLYALPPCIGTALILYASTARSCNRLLSNRVLVGLGLISYSLYLIHWPMIVFYRYYTKSELVTAERWAICGLSILLAAMMYRWVETPFRRRSSSAERWSPGAFGLSCAMFALVICVVSASAWANRGWPWRFGGTDAIRAFGQIDEMRRERGLFLSRHMTATFEDDTSKVKILVVGDSLGSDLVVGLLENLGERFGVLQDRYHELCYPAFADGTAYVSEKCSKVRKALDYSLKLPVADMVFVSYRGSPKFRPAEFVHLVKYLRRRMKPGAQIVLVGRGPEFPGFQSVAVSMLGDGESIRRVEEKAREVAGDGTALDLEIRAAADELGIDFVSKFDMFCSDDRCKYFTDQNSLMFWDQNHMTIEAAKWYGARVIERTGGSLGSALGRASPWERGRAPDGAAPLSPAAAARLRLSRGEAVEIIEVFFALLKEMDLDGNSVFDTARLSHPKDRIEAAVRLMLARTADPDRRASLKTAGHSLAFFQSGVGEGGLAVDDMGPGEQTWRDVVEEEMAEIATALGQ